MFFYFYFSWSESYGSFFLADFTADLQYGLSITFPSKWSGKEKSNNLIADAASHVWRLELLNDELKFSVLAVTCCVQRCKQTCEGI